ncbi:MAG: hypothetical protein WBP08_08450 [Saprospiraceae bacterium]
MISVIFILFVAYNVDDKRKGINYFLDAIKFGHLPEAKVLLEGGGNINLPTMDAVKKYGSYKLNSHIG